jgi:hypothetical protein
MFLKNLSVTYYPPITLMTYHMSQYSHKTYNNEASAETTSLTPFIIFLTMDDEDPLSCPACGIILYDYNDLKEHQIISKRCSKKFPRVARATLQKR